MRLAMAQVSRGRANQLRNLMRMLEFRAIYLDQRPRIAKQNLRARFHDARLARTRRPQEEQITHWPSRRIQPGAKHLVQVDQCLQAFVLADDFRPQRRLKFQRIGASLVWIKWQYMFSHGRLPSASATAATLD